MEFCQPQWEMNIPANQPPSWQVVFYEQVLKCQPIFFEPVAGLLVQADESEGIMEQPEKRKVTGLRE